MQDMEDTEKSKNYEMTINVSKYKDLRYFVKESIFLLYIDLKNKKIIV